MNLQDRSVVRTAADLERKYNLSKLVGLAGNIETNSESLIKVENELNKFIETTAGNFEDIQKQIDGSITTYYYSGVPTLSNLPVSEWPLEEYINHIGDLYYDKDTGYAYRFVFDGETNEYKWLELSDSSVSEALAIANAAKDTADSKRRIFVSQPTTPYDVGDLWVQGENGDIVVCQLSRATGNYDAGDWITASKYTDDTVAEAIVDELGGKQTTVLGGTVTQYTKDWVKFTDLATGGSTVISGDLITTGNIKSKNYVSKTSGMKIDLDNGTLDSKNLTLSSDGTLDVGGYIKSDRGLLTNLQFISNKNFLGQRQIVNEGVGISASWIGINYKIPDNFEIVSAIVTLKTFKTENCYFYQYATSEADSEVTAYGKVKNIRLYKEDSTAEFLNHWYWAGEVMASKTTEITSAFGSSGYTATSVEGASVQSKDLKNENLKNYNMLYIKTADADLNGETLAGITAAAQQTQYAYAVLDIIGYLKIS